MHVGSHLCERSVTLGVHHVNQSDILLQNQFERLEGFGPGTCIVQQRPPTAIGDVGISTAL